MLQYVLIEQLFKLVRRASFGQKCLEENISALLAVLITESESYVA